MTDRSDAPVDTHPPHLLFVDDTSDTSEGTLRELFRPEDVDVRLREPENLSIRDLERANLVVVDYFLSEWPERNTSAPARAPQDGLAVVANLRSQLLPTLPDRALGVSHVPPIAFALWSAHLQEATFGLPAALREHVFARENNLEWAFSRESIISGHAVSQLADLARAVHRLPDRWPGRQNGDAAIETLTRLLDLPPTDSLVWLKRGRDQVLSSCPPVFELSERSHGLAVLRWLLHRILPYPTFLIDRQYLKARLRVDMLPNDAGAPLWSELRPARYTGILGQFAGERWWRAGVENWLWNATGGQSGDPQVVADHAISLGATAKRKWRQPVVVIGPDYLREDSPAELEDTVRIRPDDWPPYADSPFAKLITAREEPRLMALVDAADRHLLGEFDGTCESGQ